MRHRALRSSLLTTVLFGALAASSAGCGSSLAVVAPGTAGSTNVRDSGARPTPGVLSAAIERDGTLRGLVDPQSGLVVVRSYTDAGDGAEVRNAVRQCGAELARTMRSLDAHLELEQPGAIRCTGDACKDPSQRALDPHRVFLFRQDPRLGLVLDAVLLLGDAGLSERGLASEVEWARAQIEGARAAGCAD